jgi:hypothetical protein
MTTVETIRMLERAAREAEARGDLSLAFGLLSRIAELRDRRLAA